MPLLWIEESATADEPAASRFKQAIQNKLILGNAVLITAISLSLALFLICFILLIFYMARRSVSLEKNNLTHQLIVSLIN